MLARCRNTKRTNYGGRGITVCERWQTFEHFLADMGERPPEMTLDRIDNDGNYELSNCRWSTNKEQSANRRRNGPQRLTPADVVSIRKDTRLHRTIAAEYDVALGTIRAIKSHRLWRNIV